MYVAKLYAHWLVVNYVRAYGMYAVTYFLTMNLHSGEKRNKKITRGLSNIFMGLEPCLYMGNVDSLRDWVIKRLYRNAMVNASTKHS